MDIFRSVQIDQISANARTYYLYLKAMQVHVWLQYSPVPPPLNMLSLPYYCIGYPLISLYKSWFESQLEVKPEVSEAPSSSSLHTQEPKLSGTGTKVSIDAAGIFQVSLRIP